MAELQAKIEKRLKERERMVAEIQGAVDILAGSLKKLTDHDIKTYSMLNKPDTLFMDSPISSLRTYHNLKQHMIKRDMDFVGFAFDGKPAIKTFIECASDTAKWCLRYSSEPEKLKQGIDAIL